MADPFQVDGTRRPAAHRVPDPKPAHAVRAAPAAPSVRREMPARPSLKPATATKESSAKRKSRPLAPPAAAPAAPTAQRGSAPAPTTRARQPTGRTQLPNGAARSYALSFRCSGRAAEKLGRMAEAWGCTRNGVLNRLLLEFEEPKAAVAAPPAEGIDVSGLRSGLLRALSALDPSS